MSDAPEVLVYPRFVEGLHGTRIDNSSIIARFRAGEEFTDRTTVERKTYRITRIDRTGIWGVEMEREPALEPSK